jgi:uncharacterized protein YdcH (DUF465 family)
VSECKHETFVHIYGKFSAGSITNVITIAKEVCVHCGMSRVEIDLRAKLEAAEKSIFIKDQANAALGRYLAEAKQERDEALDSWRICQNANREQNAEIQHLRQLRLDLKSQITVMRGALEKITKQNMVQTMERIAHKALADVDALQSTPDRVTGLVEALEKLARLGNGDRYGNSDGNVIAQDALRAWREEKTHG